MWISLDSEIPQERIFPPNVILQFLIKAIKHTLIVKVLILAVRQYNLVQFLNFLENIQRNYRITLLFLLNITIFLYLLQPLYRRFPLYV